MVQAYAGAQFKTWSGLGFSYQLRRGRNGEFTRELWIDRREQSKSLAWSSVMLALRKVSDDQQAMPYAQKPASRQTEGAAPVIHRPKDLGDIRGISYIYAMFYRFGIIDVPEKVKAKMGR